MRKKILFAAFLLISIVSVAQTSDNFEVITNVWRTAYAKSLESYTPDVHFPQGYGLNEASFLPQDVKVGDSLGFQSFHWATDSIHVEPVEFYNVIAIKTVNNKRIIFLDAGFVISTLKDVWMGNAVSTVDDKNIINSQGDLDSQLLKRAAANGHKYEVSMVNNHPSVAVVRSHYVFGYYLSKVPDWCKTDRQKQKK